MRPRVRCQFEYQDERLRTTSPSGKSILIGTPDFMSPELAALLCYARMKPTREAFPLYVTKDLMREVLTISQQDQQERR